MYIYEIGSNTQNEDIINSGGIEKDDFLKEKLMTIIINGNKQSNIEEFNLESEEDLYIATKIAIDCCINNYPADQINTYYEIKDNITNDLKTRAEKIINGAAKILNIPGVPMQAESVRINRVEEYGVDDINPNYYSQKYEVKVSGGELTKYKITTKQMGLKSYLTTNTLDQVNKTEFSNDESIFKIMIPYEDRELPFEIEMSADIQYSVDCIYRAVGENSEYIIYGKTEKEEQATSDTLFNKKSTLTINFVNSKTLEKVYGVIVEVNGERFEINSENKLILEGLGKGEIIIKIISIPEGYIDIGNQYKINVPYAEDYIENIELIPKKEEIDKIPDEENNIKDKEESDKIEKDNNIKNDETQTEDKIKKEDTEVKENVNSNTDNPKEERKKLPRTRK